MGAFTYLRELWRKKQSDSSRYLRRARVWEYRNTDRCVRVSHPTNTAKAHMLGYKAKQGFCIFRYRIRRGDRKQKASKGIIYGKPKHSGINTMKNSQSLQTVAEQ